MNISRIRSISFCIVLCLAFAYPRIASSQEAETSAVDSLTELKNDQDIVVELQNGDTLKGKFLETRESTFLMTHESMGTVTVIIADVKSITDPNAPQPQKIWSFSAEAGLNGSEGNSRKVDIRAGMNVKRETERNILTADANYNLGYARDDDTGMDERNSNQFTCSGRSEWPFKIHPRLRYFIGGNCEYDEFKDYDWRVVGNTGFSYKIVDTKKTSLLGRVGFGASREFGGMNDEIVPEGIVGLELEHTINEFQKFSASSEIYPEFRDVGEFRNINKAKYEIFLSQKKNLSFNLGVEHRYESDPGLFVKNNDIDYYLTLAYKF